MKSLKRRVADRLGDAFDSYIISKGNAYSWPERFFVERMLGRLKPDCIFDVGANGGQYGNGLRADGFSGLILSFEPNPEAFERLRTAAAGDAKWHCYPYAFGRAAGTATFNVMHDDVFSSFRTPLSGPGVDFAEENIVSWTIDVPVERLEDALPGLMADHGFSNPFLKMDTQGFDLEVFAGAGSQAQRFCGVLSEVSIRKIYADSPDMMESVKAFEAAGFNVAALHSVHPGLPLKTIEFNCYCIRHDLAERDRHD